LFSRPFIIAITSIQILQRFVKAMVDDWQAGMVEKSVHCDYYVTTVGGIR